MFYQFPVMNPPQTTKNGGKHIQLLCVSMCLHAYIYIHVYNVYKCTISFLCGCLEVSKLFER